MDNDGLDCRSQVVELQSEEYSQLFGGKDGPSAPSASLVPEDALFVPQGGADASAEEVREVVEQKAKLDKGSS